MDDRMNKPEAYLLTFVIDGGMGFSEELTPGTVTESISAPKKHGYTFSGWLGLPAVMPEENITVYGSFEPNRHDVCFVVDGKTVATERVAYGDVIKAPEMPEREGYCFSGFGEIPEAMPDNALTFEGHYLPKVYHIFYQLDGVTCFPEEVPYGERITAIPDPERENHTFSGWKGLPETMPAQDITVEGSFIPRSFDLIYVHNGEVIRRESVPCGTKLPYPEAPVWEGYQFLGWKEAPAVMPARDVVISGVSEEIIYRIEYRVDGTAVYFKNAKYGSPFPKIDPPERIGYTFTGWDVSYATVPAEDVVVSGEFIKNAYRLTYTIDGETVFSFNVPYEDPLELLPEPEKEGYTFSGWEAIPEKMPAGDLEIRGSFTEIPKEEAPEPVLPEENPASEEVAPAETPVEEAPVEETPAQDEPSVDEAYVRNYSYMTGVSPEDCYSGSAMLTHKLFGMPKILATVHISDEEILAVVGPDPKKRGNLSELRFSIPTDGCIKEGRIVDPDAFRDTLRTFWDEHALPKKGISLLIDTPNFREKVLTVSPMSYTRTRDYVSTQYLPSERLSAPLFDFHVLSENKAARTRQIYAVMADRNDVNAYKDAFRALGVQIASVDPALLSALRCIGGLSRGKTGVAQYVSGYSLLTVLFINGIYAYSVRSVLPEKASAKIWGKEAYTSALQVFRYAFKQGVQEPIKEVLVGAMHPTEGSICKNGVLTAFRDFIADPEVAPALEGREVTEPRFSSFVYPVSGSF